MDEKVDEVIAEDIELSEVIVECKAEVGKEANSPDKYVWLIAQTHL